MQSNRGGRSGAISWVQMSSANPTISTSAMNQQQQQQQQQHDNPGSSLSSLRNTSSSSMHSGSTTSGSIGFGVSANLDIGSSMVSAPSSFISPPINSLNLISDQIASAAGVISSSATSQQQQSIGGGAAAAAAAAGSGSSSSSISNSNFDQQVVATTRPSNLVSLSIISPITDSVNDDLEQQQKEEENRKLRLQLYVFVLRCISYSFNAKQTSANELHHRQQQLKLRKNQLEQIIHLHTRFVSNGSHSFASSKCPHQHLKLSPIYLKQLDELYERCHIIFNRKFLQNERMKLLVESECCSQQDLRELFRQNIEQILKESGIFSQSNKLIGGISYHSTTPTSKRMSLRDAQQLAASGQSGQQVNSGSRFNETRGSFKLHSSCEQTSGAILESEQNIGGFSSLLASKDVIINSWLIKFESIIREDPNSSDSNLSGSINLTEPLAPPLSAPTPTQLTSNNALTSAVTSTTTTTTTTSSNVLNSTNLLQQQQNFTKEQLYQMFQNILNIKKFEHQLLYNALQLDSADEQAAAIRRELDGRIARIAELERNKKLMPKFVLKEMESLYLEEARMSVNKLIVNLDSLPVMKGGSNESRGGVYGLQKFRRYNNRLLANRINNSDNNSKTSQLRELELLKSKYPLSYFLISNAQRPFWSLAYNSLSSFGKMAAQASLTREGLVESHPSEPQLTKLDVVLTFNIEVIVMEVRGLRQLAPNREIYCTMEIEGSERLQTEHVLAKKPLWDTQGDFTTNHPLPVLKIKLYAVNPSMLSLEDKELGKLVLRPTVLSPKTPEWCTMQPTTSGGSSSITSSTPAGGVLSSTNPSSTSGGTGSGSTSASISGSGNQANDQDLKIRVIVRMDRPQQLKHCGYLYGIGKSTWRKLKRRYHILIQVSQYTFVMCSYRDKKAKPTEMLQLDGYTVDYIEPPTDLIMEHCTDLTTNDHHSSSTSTTLGLAGRLANVILKQPVVSSGSGANIASGVGNTLNSDPNDIINNNLNCDGNDEQQQPSAIQTAAALSDELHNKYYFNVVKEGDSVVFACDDEQECFGWVMALYRATGQAHKPTPLKNQYSGSTSHYIDAAFAYNTSATQQTKLVGNTITLANSSTSSILNGSKIGGNKSSVDVADQRARKHGMDEFISADPCKFQHNQLFKYLQNETLKYRLQDKHCSLGWFSPGQVFVLDEYCARYGVRTCHRHLAYLNSLLDFNQQFNYFIDHTLLNYGYDFCASHVSGNSGQAHPIGSVNFDLRPDGVGTVTVEERDLFYLIKGKLLKMIERQISNFSYCFPFGKPDGALKATLSLLERVFMKEQHLTNSMIQNEEVRQLIKKCLEQAALNNYTKLSGQANLLAPPITMQSMISDTPTFNTGDGSRNSLDIDSEQQQLNTHHQTSDGSIKLRTLSNLSNSSGGSYGSSSLSSSTAGVNNATVSSSVAVTGTAAVATTTSPTTPTSNRHNDSFRRRLPNPPGAPKSTNLVSSSSPTTGKQTIKTTDNKQPQYLQQCLTMAMIINNDHIKPKDKLRYLTRLAELCCEQVEENNEYFSDAFAWHSDLMMDHFELFWSLFSVDMDKILNELSGGAAAAGGGGGSATVSGNSNLSANLNHPTSGTPINQAHHFYHSTQAQTTSSSGTTSSSSDLLGSANREVFALFQVLNNHMRKSSNLECRKFKIYLCNTFKPKLLRYIDIMESTLTRMLFKAYEKDSQVNCLLIEQMFFRLEDLQKFVLFQLRWPDDHLAEQLHQRLKLIAYELCDACVQRTLQAFQQSERKSSKWTATATSYSSPVDMIQMINLALETRNKSLKLCTFNNFDQMSYHSKIDKLVETALSEMQPGLMAKMIYALESTLTKLARYDEGNLLAPILSLTYKQGMSSSGRDIGKNYVTFVSNCCDLMRNKINDELWIVNLLEDWYAAQMNIICNWLSERIDHSLHDVQLAALTTIMPKVYADMSLQGVSEEKLNLKTYQTIMSRLKMEEATAATGGNLFEQSNTSIFTTSILSSLTSSSSATSSSPSGNTGGATSGTGAQSSGIGVSNSSQLGGVPSTQSTNIMTTGGGVGQSSSGGGGVASSLLGRQSIIASPFQQKQSGDSQTILNRRFQPSGLNLEYSDNNNNNNNNSQQQQQQEGDNIADRALQGATRMFKGFWANN